MARKDDAPEPRKPPPLEAGKIPDGKLGCYDAKGRLRGHVGPLASSITASRFTQTLGMTLGKGPDGKPAWLAPKRSSPHAAK